MVWIYIVLGTSIWVLIDAQTIGVKKSQIKGLFGMGPIGWFFACLLLWIIAFPAYIAKRGEYKRLAALRTMPHPPESAPVPDSANPTSMTTQISPSWVRRAIRKLMECFFWCGIFAGVGFLIYVVAQFYPSLQGFNLGELGVNDLPKCDSGMAEDTAKQAVANGALSKFVNFQIISFEKVQYSKPIAANDKQTFCKADVLTNIGKQVLYYTISKTADGNYYVQTSLLPNGDYEAPASATPDVQPNTEASETGGEPFKKYVGKYPPDMFDNEPSIKQRLQALLGADYDKFMERIETTSPIEVYDNVLIAKGCKAHFCGSEEAILLINLADGKFHCVISSDEYGNKPKIFSEDPNALPQDALKHATEQ